MKLRNKKTGDIGYLIVGKGSTHYVVADNEWNNCGIYNSLAELNEEWEDAPEEPKEYWYIEEDGDVIEMAYQEDDKFDQKRRQIGNYFDTREEAEKAVEKLKAFKRLKDKGLKLGMDLSGVYGTTMIYGIKITASDYNEADDETRADLDLFFGGEE